MMCIVHDLAGKWAELLYAYIRVLIDNQRVEAQGENNNPGSITV